jgi:hypothetical protein
VIFGGVALWRATDGKAGENCNRKCTKGVNVGAIYVHINLGVFWF